MDFYLALIISIDNILNLGKDYIDVVLISLKVSLTAIIISFSISIPIASFLATKNFYGKSFLIVLISTLMSVFCYT